MELVNCPKPGCGRLRASPGSSMCHLASDTYLRDLLRKSRLAAERRELEWKKRGSSMSTTTSSTNSPFPRFSIGNDPILSAPLAADPGPAPGHLRGQEHPMTLHPNSESYSARMGLAPGDLITPDGDRVWMVYGWTEDGRIRATTSSAFVNGYQPGSKCIPDLSLIHI